MKTIVKCKKFSLTTVLTVFFALSAVSIAAYADEVIEPQASIYGMTSAEWSGAWWKWALSVPGDRNPILDPDGGFCAEGQSGRVWFLAGNFGGTVERSCTVPPGKAIFFPIVNFICVATEPEETEQMERDCANGFIDGISFLEVILDGEKVTMLRNHRAESPAFNVTLPEGNLFGLDPGVYGPAVSDGYWVMLKPLKPGKHELSFQGTASGFHLEVTYHLEVAAK